MLKEVVFQPEAELCGVKADRIKKICFVCTGNTCRSPMAAAVLNHLGREKYISYSAGIFANTGDPINERSVKALEKAGILPDDFFDYREHKAVRIDELICEGYDKIIAMTERQLEMLTEIFPKYSHKFSTMVREIPDPFMCQQEVYDDCLFNITLCIKEMFEL